MSPRRRTGVLRSFTYAASAVVGMLLVAGCGGEDLGGPKLPTDADALVVASAESMGSVETVRFRLDRTGAPVWVDAARSTALDGLEGRFAAPRSAEAILDVTVTGDLRTKIGAVAIDDEVWMSNPVTGVFETLPPSYDIDPSLFFDPEDGWRPLLESLTEVVYVAEEERDGTRYHLTATAPAAEMQTITAGLVRGQDVDLDLWLHPATAQVTDVEFATEFDGATTDWVLSLREYGEPVTITDPTLGSE